RDAAVLHHDLPRLDRAVHPGLQPRRRLLPDPHPQRRARAPGRHRAQLNRVDRAGGYLGEPDPDRGALLLCGAEALHPRGPFGSLIGKRRCQTVVVRGATPYGADGRSPIGRARKGSLVDVRPDDLAAHVVTKVLDKVPALDPTQIEDLICGCGLPGGEQGHNIGRVVSILARLDVPGVTVNRYCSSSLMTTRMAAHAIEAGEGDAF